ncbi:hypothetical protein [Streptomyces sp. NPDC056291]|uniref:hypothetical protein n=1 Tax=unclassified Streptomyces TaxID=2593676 RepID=UPI0035E0B7A1
MTTRRPKRRLAPWIAMPVGGGALALAAKFSSAPGWALALLAVASVVPALLPQESKHRRDVWRDWLRHRERMARLRHKAVNPEPVTAKERKDHPNIPADRAA